MVLYCALSEPTCIFLYQFVRTVCCNLTFKRERNVENRFRVSFICIGSAIRCYRTIVFPIVQLYACTIVVRTILQLMFFLKLFSFSTSTIGNSAGTLLAPSSSSRPEKPIDWLLHDFRSMAILKKNCYATVRTVPVPTYGGSNRDNVENFHVVRKDITRCDNWEFLIGSHCQFFLNF